MRRPEPLPTPPRSEPEPREPEVQSADSLPAGPRQRGRRASAGSSQRPAVGDAGPPQDEDTIDTAVEVESIVDWERSHERAPEIDRAEAASIDAAPTEPPSGTRRRDVWRAARARKRTLRHEARRFTVRSRRRRMWWLIAIGSVLAVTVGSFVIAYSPLFAVQQITVVGAKAVPAADIQKALREQIGTPLAAVNDSAVKAALVKFPMIETYAVVGKPPHELEVRIVERTPVGVVKSGAGYSLVDAAGVVLSTSTAPPAGQPVITVSGGLSSPVFRAAGQVVRALPDSVRKLVTAVSATSANDVTLTLGATKTSVVWGSADDSQKKALALAAAMKASPPGKVSLYDVSSPSAVVMR